MHPIPVCWLSWIGLLELEQLESGTSVFQSWCYPFLMLPSLCIQKLWDDCKGLMNTCNFMQGPWWRPTNWGPKMQTFFSSLLCARGRIIVWSAIPQLPRGAKKWPHGFYWCSNNTTDFHRMILERCSVYYPKLLNPIKKSRHLLPFLFILLGPIMIVKCHTAKVLFTNTGELDHLKKGGGMMNSATSGGQTKWSGLSLYWVFHYIFSQNICWVFFSVRWL